MAQPSLTRAIKQLEDELGGRLFHREHSSTQLTELGRAMRPYLQEVIRQSEKAKGAAAAMATLNRTPLKLGIMCTIGPGNLVGLIAALQDKHPGVDLQIVDGAAQDLYDRLVSADLEAAIYCLPETEDDRLHMMRDDSSPDGR